MKLYDELTVSRICLTSNWSHFSCWVRSIDLTISVKDQGCKARRCRILVLIEYFSSDFLFGDGFGVFCCGVVATRDWVVSEEDGVEGILLDGVDFCFLILGEVVEEIGVDGFFVGTFSCFVEGRGEEVEILSERGISSCDFLFSGTGLFVTEVEAGIASPRKCKLLPLLL